MGTITQLSVYKKNKTFGLSVMYTNKIHVVNMIKAF